MGVLIDPKLNQGSCCPLRERQMQREPTRVGDKPTSDNIFSSGIRQLIPKEAPMSSSVLEINDHTPTAGLMKKSLELALPMVTNARGSEAHQVRERVGEKHNTLPTSSMTNSGPKGRKDSILLRRKGVTTLING